MAWSWFDKLFKSFATKQFKIYKKLNLFSNFNYNKKERPNTYMYPMKNKYVIVDKVSKILNNNAIHPQL